MVVVRKENTGDFRTIPFVLLAFVAPGEACGGASLFAFWTPPSLR